MNLQFMHHRHSREDAFCTTGNGEIIHCGLDARGFTLPVFGMMLSLGAILFLGTRYLLAGSAWSVSWPRERERETVQCAFRESFLSSLFPLMHFAITPPSSVLAGES